LPATVVVAAVEVPDYGGQKKRSGDVIRSFRSSNPRGMWICPDAQG
jgi:hypothetical protein